MDPILLQKKVTENAEELQSLVSDLIDWEKEMKRKELSRTETEEELPPIRSKLCRSMMKEETSNLSEDRVEQRQKREQSLLEKERGNELVKQGKYAEAVHHYTKAIEYYPKDATFYANRAFCFLNTKQWKEVETDCTIALQIDPNYVKAYHRRALALKELNQLSEAHEDLQKALSIEPDNSRLKADFAKIEKLVNDKIISDSKSALSKEANKTAAYLIKEKGNNFVKKGNWQAAIENYTEACRLYPEDSSFYSNRALCYLKLNEPKKTILDCIRALELDPNNTKALFRKALANEILGNDTSAHDDLLNAFKLDPTNKAIGDELDKIEKKLGLRKENEPGTNKQSQPAYSSNKRISGEKFLKLGGKFVKPIKKPPHLVSKKPMKKIPITNKSEIDLLQNALEEVMPNKNIPSIENPNDTKQPENTPKVKLIPIKVGTPGIDVNSLPIPKTSIQFNTSWNKLLSDPILQYQYLKRINGKNLPNIFKDALETDVFSQLIEILATEFVKANDPLYDYLHGLSTVKRFSALILFASDEDKENIKIAIDHCDALKEVSASDMSALKSRFYY